MRAHLSAPHGKRAGRDGKRTPRHRSRRFCRSPCGHTFSPWLRDVDEEVSVCYVVVLVCGPKLPQARIFWKSRSRYVRALAPAEREAYYGGVPFRHHQGRLLLRDFVVPTPGGPSKSLSYTCASNMFRATSRLLNCRITFFTRSPCGLCDNAKAVVQKVETKRPLIYEEINVMDPGQEKWKGMYEFDTPVVSLGSNSCSEGVPKCRADPHRQGRCS
jgi:hypothetical protein